MMMTTTTSSSHIIICTSSFVTLYSPFAAAAAAYRERQHRERSQRVSERAGSGGRGTREVRSDKDSHYGSRRVAMRFSSVLLADDTTAML